MPVHADDHAPRPAKPASAWLALCRDIADSGELRRQYLDQHLAYIESVMDRVAVAGPLSHEAGASFSGSCFIYHVENLAAAESLLHNDPYYQAGLYESVELHAFRPAAGIWIGGASW